MTGSLAVLAGGEGSRMGRPKGELRVDGRPVLAYLLDRWRWEGPTLLVTAPGRERPPGCERFSREVVDPVAGEGPLRGVITALRAARTGIVLVTSCDMPRIEARQLAWLEAALVERPSASLIMIAREPALEPVPFAVHTRALPRLEEHFATGARSLHSLAKFDSAVVIAAPSDWPAEVWTNLNTVADLAAFKAPSATASRPR